jgi:hypothetical protein
MNSILRPLCGVNPEAAMEVISLTKSAEPEIAKRALLASEWPDILWPDRSQG